jgi:hypothetical protein
MLCIGRLHQNYLEVIRGVYEHYRDPDRDLSIAKSIILHFIIKNHATHSCHSLFTDDYKLNISNLYSYNALKFELKNNEDVSYHVCMKSGNIILVYIKIQ